MRAVPGSYDEGHRMHHRIYKQIILETPKRRPGLIITSNGLNPELLPVLSKC